MLQSLAATGFVESDSRCTANCLMSAAESAFV